MNLLEIPDWLWFFGLLMRRHKLSGILLAKRMHEIAWLCSGTFNMLKDRYHRKYEMKRSYAVEATHVTRYHTTSIYLPETPSTYSSLFTSQLSLSPETFLVILWVVARNQVSRYPNKSPIDRIKQSSSGILWVPPENWGQGCLKGTSSPLRLSLVWMDL